MGIIIRFFKIWQNNPQKKITVVFSNLLLEGLEWLWEVHEFLPDPKHFPLATEDSVS
jgi:hypothetical protein